RSRLALITLAAGLSFRSTGCKARSLRLPQPVADANLGHDVLRSFRIGLDLAAQLANVYPQVLWVGWFVPELLNQEFVREHLARVLDQQAQQVVFLGRELHFPAAYLDDASHEIDAQISDMEQRSLSVLLELMPHGCAHTREELAH